MRDRFIKLFDKFLITLFKEFIEQEKKKMELFDLIIKNEEKRLKAKK